MALRSDPRGYNYSRFQGWRLPVLLLIFLLYTLWFTGPGPFGELAGLTEYKYLQSRGFYSGAEAVAAIESLSSEARAIKFKALGFDLIYMVLQMWVFEACMVFGLSARQLMTSNWKWVLMLPILFMLFDFLEGSLLALVMLTSSNLLGSLAGLCTLMKFAFFIPSMILSISLLLAGIVTIFFRNRKT